MTESKDSPLLGIHLGVEPGRDDPRGIGGGIAFAFSLAFTLAFTLAFIVAFALAFTLVFSRGRGLDVADRLGALNAFAFAVAIAIALVEARSFFSFFLGGEEGVGCVGVKGLQGRAPSETLVRTGRIVDGDGVRTRAGCFAEGLVVAADVPGVLERVVDALGNGVVEGISSLRHADAIALVAEALGVAVGGVLDASVAVVNHVLDVNVVLFVEVERLVERLEATFDLEGWVKAVADDAPSVGVGEEREVGETASVGDVGDVRHDEGAGVPGLVFGLGVEQVFVLVEGVVGVGSAGAIPALAEHEAVGSEEVAKAVSPEGELTSKALTTEAEKLPEARLREMLPTAQEEAVEDDARLQDAGGGEAGGGIGLAFIESLTAEAKQFAEGRNEVLGTGAL